MTGHTRVPRAEITGVYGAVALGIEAEGLSASCGLAPMAQPSGTAPRA
jgi:hypothetical protein